MEVNSVEDLLATIAEKGLTVDEELEIHKAIGQFDPAHFAETFMGVTLAKHQNEMLTFIDNPNNKRVLMLEPRDHGKSFAITFVYPIWKLAYDHNLRILLISKTNNQARKFLTLIRETVQRLPALQTAFHLIPSEEGNPWSQTMVYVQREGMLKDPSVECIGLGGAITGGHFDLIIADDVVDAGDETSKKNMEDTLEWLRGTMANLAEPNTRIVFVGTRKSFRDLYSILMEENVYAVKIEQAVKKMPSKWSFVKGDHGNIIGVNVETQDAEVLWPDKWSTEALLMKRAELGEIMFNREMQNDPAGMQGNYLKYDWLEFVDELPPENTLRNVYMGVDPAISLKENADYFAAAVVKEYSNGYWYIDQIMLDRLEFPDQVKRLTEMHATYKPRKIYVEKVAYQAALTQQLIRGTNLPVIPVSPSSDKSTKFISMAPYFENGKVKIRKGVTGVFVNQWVEFPNSTHDDALDAVFYALTAMLDADKPTLSTTGGKGVVPPKGTLQYVQKYFTKVG